MSVFLSRPRVAATLVVAALTLWCEGRAEAQFGIGFGIGGEPFGFYTPQMVPSPTSYLYDVQQARIAAHANASQQSAAQALRSNPNAYWNNLRDNSGENSFDLRSRQSLSRRVGTPSRPRPSAAPTPAPAPIPPRPTLHPLESYFLDGTHFDWPRDAPDDSDRGAAEQSLRTVLEQIHAKTGVTAQSVAAARAKLITYGQTSLARVRAERSTVVSNVYHYFLLFLNDTLLDLGGDNSP